MRLLCNEQQFYSLHSRARSVRCSCLHSSRRRLHPAAPARPHHAYARILCTVSTLGHLPFFLYFAGSSLRLHNSYAPPNEDLISTSYLGPRGSLPRTSTPFPPLPFNGPSCRWSQLLSFLVALLASYSMERAVSAECLCERGI